MFLYSCFEEGHFVQGTQDYQVTSRKSYIRPLCIAGEQALEFEPIHLGPPEGDKG